MLRMSSCKRTLLQSRCPLRVIRDRIEQVAGPAMPALLVELNDVFRRSDVMRRCCLALQSQFLAKPRLVPNVQWRFERWFLATMSRRSRHCSLVFCCSMLLLLEITGGEGVSPATRTG